MIVISAGHYGKGTGAVGFMDEVEEAIRVVQRVTALLKQNGVKVTSIIDKTSTTQRQNLAYLARAHKQANGQLDVYVHFNATSTKQQQAIGTEVLYKNAQMKPLAAQLSEAISTAAGLKNRGAKVRNDLYMLYTVGGVLLEVCFVNSQQDVALYKQHFDAICQAIANVLVQHVGVKKPQFSSNTLQTSYEQLTNDAVFRQQLIAEAIARGVIQPTWQQKVSSLTELDICSIALLILKKHVF